MISKLNNYRGKEELTVAVRENWHAARWDRRALKLSNNFKHKLHPRTLNTRAHSTFGSGPRIIEKM